MRTFNTPINSKELGALAKFFKSSIVTKVTEDSDIEEEEKEKVNVKEKVIETIRINTQEFLIYFNKIQREEQSKRHTERIEKERELINKEKEYKISLIRKKENEELESLIFSENDENTFLVQHNCYCCYCYNNYCQLFCTKSIILCIVIEYHNNINK